MKKYTYRELKEKTRQLAKDWQYSIMTEQETPSLDEFWDMQTKFEKLGKRYGLIKEFRENGII